MESTPRIEAIIVACYACICIFFLSNTLFPEIRRFILLLSAALLAILGITVLICIGLADTSDSKRTKRPLWSLIGYLLLFIGGPLWEYPVLGILLTIAGLTIFLYALYCEENKNRDEAETNPVKGEIGAEGEI